MQAFDDFICQSEESHRGVGRGPGYRVGWKSSCVHARGMFKRCCEKGDSWECISFRRQVFSAVFAVPMSSWYSYTDTYIHIHPNLHPCRHAYIYIHIHTCFHTHVESLCTSSLCFFPRSRTSVEAEAALAEVEAEPEEQDEEEVPEEEFWYVSHSGQTQFSSFFFAISAQDPGEEGGEVEEDRWQLSGRHQSILSPEMSARRSSPKWIPPTSLTGCWMRPGSEPSSLDCHPCGGGASHQQRMLHDFISFPA